MAANEITLEQIYAYFVENGGKVKNRDAVRHFKKYLTDPEMRDENRNKFKQYVNGLAHTRLEDNEKVLILKSKYLTSLNPPASPPQSPAPLTPSDPRNSLGIPSSEQPHSGASTPSRQPPPYRHPPPVISPSPSLDSISLGSSITNLSDCQSEPPQAPPRRRDSDKLRNSQPLQDGAEGDDKAAVSVKERTQKFNRMASTEEELSPRIPKSAEKEKSRPSWNSHEEDLPPLEPKKCQEWYVTASRADLLELLKLAKAEPRLVNKKDPFSAYNVLHWGAKFGNSEIIKIFAGTYKVNVNSKTNGGYTPLHISAQFGHKHIFKLLIEVYKADTKIRDYSGKTAEHYLFAKEQKENSGVTLRKIKGRKKQSEKDLGFLRIGSFNVRVKKTTEAFSNFLGVGGGGAVNPSDPVSDKVHKGWGSADNVSKDGVGGGPKAYLTRRKSKRSVDSGLSSTPTTPKTQNRSFSSPNPNDSDSDTAAGFDSNWKN